MKLQMSLISAACVVIILAGLKAAGAIIVPFLLAIFITVLISPLMLSIQKLRVGRFFSFLIVVFAFVCIIGFLGDIVFGAVREFSAQLPELGAKFNKVLGGAQERLGKYGLELDLSTLSSEPSEMVSRATAVAKKTGSIVSSGFFIFILVSFMVFESSVIDAKIKYFASKNRAMHKFMKKYVRRFL